MTDDVNNDDLSFSPLLNSTVAEHSNELELTDSEVRKEDAAITVQYITERLIKRVTQQENLWMIKKLDLTLSTKGHYIKKIKRIENLENLRQLEYLSLSNNVIEKIENLNHLHSLRVLNLSHNQIEKVDNIASLINLEVLNLSHNNIAILPYRTFKHLQRIRKLDVSNNCIAEFSTQIKQIRDLRLLGNLVDFSFHNNPLMEQAPHATDTAVFYLRGLEKLNGSPVKTEMRVSADKRYQQDEVNALQDEILGKTRMIDAVSREREDVVRVLEEKKTIEEKLRRSGNTSMLRISELEEELQNTKQLLEQRTNDLTAACYKHYALEQELSMYKVDVRFRDIGPPPDVFDTAVNEYIEESGYVSKAPLYPCQYGMKTSGHTQVIDYYNDKDYTEEIPDEREKELLEQQLIDKEREKRKIEKRLAELEKELEEKERLLEETQNRLSEIEKKLSDEARLREELEVELDLKNEELEHLRDVERRMREAEAEVDDLHRSLQNKTKEVKELRNQMTMTKANGMEMDHMKARLQKKEDDLEKERKAYEDARREFQEKQRELQRNAALRDQHNRTASKEEEGLRTERAALRSQVQGLMEELRGAREEREELEVELDSVKSDQERLRRDADYVQKLFADKETETEAIAEELDKTRDLVNMLQDENRKLKDEALQALSDNLNPEHEILHHTLDELEKAQAENAYLAQERDAARDRESRSPFLAREALRMSRDRLADLEDENAELRDILNASHGVPRSGLEPRAGLDPEELARRILKFLEDKLPKYTDKPETQQNVDLLPIIKLLLEERDKKSTTDPNKQDLIKLLEDLLKNRNLNGSRDNQQQPVINVNIPDNMVQSPRFTPRHRENSMLSERYLRPGSPIRTSTPATNRIYVHEEIDDDDYDPEVIHLISRKAQTDKQTDITLTSKKQKSKRVVITNEEASSEGTTDIFILDKRKDQATNTNIHLLADEMLNKFEKSTLERDQRDREWEKERGQERERERDRKLAGKERRKIDKLIEEVASLRHGLREAATQTNTVVLDSMQKRLDEAITRSNSLVSCGHEELIARLRSDVVTAEREIDMLRDAIRDRDLEQEDALTEMKIDGLGETIKDHNRSLHNLQEVLRDVMSRDSASRDSNRPRDVIIQPRDAESASEIREIQKTLLDLQYSLRNVAEKQGNRKDKEEVQHNAMCLHCTNCKRNDVDLETELRKVRVELTETLHARTEQDTAEKKRQANKEEVEKTRAEHTSLLIEIERLKTERNHINEVVGQYKTQINDIEHDKRARYHELLGINDRIAEAERNIAEHKTVEKGAVDALRQEAAELRKTLTDLNQQREQIVQEAAEMQLNLKHDKMAFEDELRQKRDQFEQNNTAISHRHEKELSALEQKIRERDATLSATERKINERDGKLTELDSKIRERDSTLSTFEQKIREQDASLSTLSGKMLDTSAALSRLEGELREREAVLSTTNRRAEERDAALSVLNRKVEERESVLHQLRVEGQDQSRQNQIMKETLDKQLDNRNEEVTQNVEKLREVAADLQDITEKKRAVERDVSDMSRSIAAYKATLQDLEKEKENVQADTKALAHKHKAGQNKLAAAKVELDGIMSETDRAKSELSRHQETIDNTASEIATLKEQKTKQKAKVKQLQEENGTLEHAIRDKKSASVSQTTRRHDLEKQVKAMEAREQECLETVETLTREISGLERQKEEEVEKLTELKDNFDSIKSKRGLLQDSFSMEEGKIKEYVRGREEERQALEDVLQSLQHKIDQLDRDIAVKTEHSLKLSEEEERAKATLSELELSKVNATNELDEHLNSAIKQKYALSTDITALKREAEQLKSQHNTLTDELAKMRNEAAVLREKIRSDKSVCEQLQETCSKAEKQYTDYCSLAEQSVQQMNSLHKNIVSVEAELQDRRSELREANSKTEQIQSLLQDRQDKLHLVEKKLLSYTQRLNSSKTTLDDNQATVTSLSHQKTDLEGQVSGLRRDIESLETAKERSSGELENKKQTLDNIRKDLAQCQKQHKQEMAKYNKLMREKAKYDNEVKSAKVQCDGHAKNLARMREDEIGMREKMGSLARDLSTVQEEFREKAHNLKSLEELRSQTSHLDREIKQKSEVLSQYDEKLGEINSLKESALQKEYLLKDSETKVANLQNQIGELTKSSVEKEQSDRVTTTGLKKNHKKLKKHLKSQMDTSTLLKKELAEQAAAAKTLELDLHAQRDAHNSILSTLEEDNASLHTKCEEQLLEIETLRLELTAARHTLGTKQAELTFVAEDVFNKSVNEDIENRLAGLGARDQIRNELMLSISELNRSKKDILAELGYMHGPRDHIPTQDLSSTNDKRVLNTINYKMNCIESTMNKDSHGLMSQDTFQDTMLATGDSIVTDQGLMNTGDSRLLNTGDSRLLNTGDSRLMNTGDSRLMNTGDSRLLNTGDSSRHRRTSLSSLENTYRRPMKMTSLAGRGYSSPTPSDRHTDRHTDRPRPISDQGYLTGYDPDTSAGHDQWYNHVE